MGSEAARVRISVETPSRTAPRDGDAANGLIVANIWVAVLAFGVAAAMAMMQAISRANLELPYRSASMYYMSVTAHGVQKAGRQHCPACTDRVAVCNGTPFDVHHIC